MCTLVLRQKRVGAAYQGSDLSPLSVRIPAGGHVEDMGGNAGERGVELRGVC